MRRVSLTAVWILIAVCFIVPIVRSQQAATKAQHAASAATEANTHLRVTVHRLSGLVSVECARSTNGAVLRNALIDRLTQHLAPGIIPPAQTAIRNRQYDAQRAYLKSLGRKIPSVRC